MRDEAFENALCRQYDPDLWHDEATERQAIELCKKCPALLACLDFATDPSNDRYVKSGVWGGLTNYNLARLRAMRGRREAAVATRPAEDETSRYQTVTFPAPNCQTPVQEFSL